MLQIRRIRPDDVGFVLALAEENSAAGGKLLSNIENFLICELDNVRCGCGCIVISGDKGFMRWVMVSSGYRRQKLGDAITRTLLNKALMKGAKTVYAVDICREFMKAMGFEEKEDKPVMDEIKEVLGDTSASSCFAVSLEGYFRPCRGE